MSAHEIAESVATAIIANAREAGPAQPIKTTLFQFVTAPSQRHLAECVRWQGGVMRGVAQEYR